MKKLTQKLIFIAIIVITTISVITHLSINNSYAYEIAKLEFRQKSSANDNAAGDLFGSSLAMAGKYALFGAIYNDDKGLMDSGSALRG